MVLPKIAVNLIQFPLLHVAVTGFALLSVRDSQQQQCVVPSRERGQSGVTTYLRGDGQLERDNRKIAVNLDPGRGKLLGD